MENSVVYDRIDDILDGVENINETVTITDSKIIANKHPGTVTVINTRMTGSQNNLQVCNVTGKGILYTAFLSSLRAGRYTVKITLDGTTYTVSGTGDYKCSPGYVAKESIIGSGLDGYDAWIAVEGCVTNWDGQFESQTPVHGNVFLKMTDATSYTHSEGVPLVFTETGIPFNNSLIVTMSNGASIESYANVLYALTD